MFLLLAFFSLLISALCVFAFVAAIKHYHSEYTNRVMRAAPILILVIGMLLCYAAIWVLSWGDADGSNQFFHNFEQLSHPTESKVVASKSRSGLLVGNSNHCDFFAGQIRWSQLTHQEIEDFYRGKTIPFASDAENRNRYKSKTAVDISIIFVEQEDIVVHTSGRLPNSLETVSDWGIDLVDYPEGILYVVYVFDVGYEPGTWDLHCH